MSTLADRLKAIITHNFPQSEIFLSDETGVDNHFSLEITSPSFAGKTKVQQHKMVYDSLGELMKNGLHALKLKTEVKTD